MEGLGRLLLYFRSLIYFGGIDPGGSDDFSNSGPSILSEDWLCGCRPLHTGVYGAVKLIGLGV